MADFIQGYKDFYGKIHATEEAADIKNREYNLYQEMYEFTKKNPIVLYPRDFEVAEYIIRHWDKIKEVMDRNG